ncbi:MAG: clostripain-related cysteine peptidase [Blastocatellales bacterium]
MSWTVMIYLAGDNNLSEESVWALKELKSGAYNGLLQKKIRTLEAENVLRNQIKINKADADSAEITIIAQFDSPSPDHMSPRYVLMPSNKDGDLDVVDKQKNVDIRATDYRAVIRDFIKWGMENYKADRYMVILSGHGSGTIGDFLAPGGTPWRSLSIPDLRVIFEDVEKALYPERYEERGAGNPRKLINVLGLDSCLMSMAEVAIEVEDYVEFLVAAEGFEPNTGWPHERIMTTLFNNPNQTPITLAKDIVVKYVDYYRDYLAAGRAVDLSACDLDPERCKKLKDAIKELAKTLKDGLEGCLQNVDKYLLRSEVVMAHWEAQSYKNDQYVDLFDFCDNLNQYTSYSDVRERCREVQRLINDNAYREANPPADEAHDDKVESVVFKSCYSGAAVQYSYGLSVFFPWGFVPWDDASLLYQKLRFAKDTCWDKFLKTYVLVTRRDPRNPRGLPDEQRKPDKTGIFTLNNSVITSVGRSTAPDDRSTAPDDRGRNNSAGSMKNPPIYYFEDNCK